MGPVRVGSGERLGVAGGDRGLHRHGRFRHQERPRDLLGRQAGEHPEGQRDPRLGGEHRVAGDEHEAQEVVVDVAVGPVGLGAEIPHVHRLPHLQVAAQLDDLLPESHLPADEVHRLVLGGGRQPRAGVARYPVLRPLLERGDECVLCDLLGEPDIAHNPGQAGDELR